VFPIGDENNGRKLTPFVNYTLIALNVLVFLYQITLPERDLYDFIYRWGAIPREISAGVDLFALLTSMFLHGGWLHIGGNMLFLWVFGDNIEDTMGHAKYLLFYLLSGLAAGYTQVIFDSNSGVPLVGASGAIAGVLGAYIMLYPRGNIRTLVILGFFVTVVLVPAWIMIGIWALLQFFNGFAAVGVATEESGGVAYWAHVGGFVAGVLLVWLFRDRDSHQRQLAARVHTQAFQRVGWSGR
jgi:membrane associated rhomboid family serine protease